MDSLVILILTLLLCYTGSARPALSFGRDSKFKVVVFADLHFGEAPPELWGPEQDRNSTRVMSSILDAEQPGLVVYLGDLVTANNLPNKNASKYWNEALSPSKERGIPWVTVFGNHDDAAFEWPPEWFGSAGIPGASEDHSYFQRTLRPDLVDSEGSETLSGFCKGPESLWPSVSNCYLNISSSTNPNSPAAILYFLDSGGGSYPTLVSARQAAWLQSLAAQINPEQYVPELLFWHIPSKAYEAVAPKPKGSIPSPCIGSINMEDVASQSAEWGTMDVLMNRTSAKAVFAGHNHGLDWCCPSGGRSTLWLCYARHTGYGGYGNWTRGARVIELSQASNTMTIKTWMRLENGSVVNSFHIA